VLVLVTDPEREVSFPDTVLRELYGLTTAETEIANGLLTGFSVEEIAQLRRVSVATVRSQLKPLLGKTGTRRQADLVRVLSTLPRTAQA
jgi:DNA-binding NarL/FixJ family response regulator